VGNCHAGSFGLGEESNVFADLGSCDLRRPRSQTAAAANGSPTADRGKRYGVNVQSLGSPPSALGARCQQHQLLNSTWS
jgi:hypothetical protein